VHRATPLDGLWAPRSDRTPPNALGLVCVAIFAVLAAPDSETGSG